MSHSGASIPVSQGWGSHGAEKSGDDSVLGTSSLQGESGEQRCLLVPIHTPLWEHIKRPHLSCNQTAAASVYSETVSFSTKTFRDTLIQVSMVSGGLDE